MASNFVKVSEIFWYEPQHSSEARRSQSLRFRRLAIDTIASYYPSADLYDRIYLTNLVLRDGTTIQVKEQSEEFDHLIRTQNSQEAEQFADAVAARLAFLLDPGSETAHDTLT